MSETEYQGTSEELSEKLEFDPNRAIYLGKILYDPESQICLVNNQQIRLTQSEAAMLQAVGIHAGKFARQDSILRAYQDLLGDQTEQVAYDSGTVGTTIHRISKKLKVVDPKGKYFESGWGKGWRLINRDESPRPAPRPAPHPPQPPGK